MIPEMIMLAAVRKDFLPDGDSQRNTVGLSKHINALWPCVPMLRYFTPASARYSARHQPIPLTSSCMASEHDSPCSRNRARGESDAARVCSSGSSSKLRYMAVSSIRPSPTRLFNLLTCSAGRFVRYSMTGHDTSHVHLKRDSSGYASVASQ